MLLLLSLYLLGLMTATEPRTPRITNHCGEAPFGAPQPTLLVPGPRWAQISGTIEVADVKGGHHHYLVMASAGCAYTFSFCGHGGSCNYDSGLSIWNADLSQQLACNMNGCGLGSELNWIAPADGLYHLRIGGMDGSSASKSYTLAYGTEIAACGPTAVDATSWTLLKRRFRD